MAASLKSLGLDRLDVEERLALIDELWESIVAEDAAIPLTDTQKAELGRRLAEHQANPHDVVPWEQVKASIIDRWQQ